MKQYEPMTWKEEAEQLRQRNIADYRRGWHAYYIGSLPPLRVWGKHYRAGWRAARNFMATWETDKVTA
jgi:hypothetical protein